MRPRIGIDLHVFDGKYQGSRTHVMEIISRVVATAPDIDFYLFLQNLGQLREQYPVFNSSNVSLVPMALTSAANRLCRVLPGFQKEKALDLLHTQYISPFLSPSPCVVTVHDILFESHPEYFPRFFKYRSKVLVRLSAMRARHVFTVSDFCRNELISRYGLDPDNISVVFNGVDFQKFYPGDAGRDLIERRGLTSGEYLLTVGRLEPRKNHLSLFRAYAALGAGAPPLVVVGQSDFGYRKPLVLLQELGIAERVTVIDDAGDSELPALYRHAKLFLYPSFAEGFGIPPLEAMASGVPVICSSTTAIPEVVGGAACLVQPANQQELTDAIATLLSGRELLHSMSSAGLARSLAFSWEKAAQITLEGYQHALR